MTLAQYTMLPPPHDAGSSVCSEASQWCARAAATRSVGRAADGDAETRHACAVKHAETGRVRFARADRRL